MDLHDKNALVTGGGSGIGLAITRALAKAGARVTVVGRDQAKLDKVRDELDGITVVRADLTERTERDRVVASLLSSDRPLDVLINNAGVMQYFDLTGDRALARLDDELALDLHAPIHLCTALLPHLLARPRAAIVNVSTGLVYAPFGITPGYSAAKAGLHAFTRSLRWQTRNTSLHVLELLPPAVDTELTRQYDGPKTDSASIALALVRGLTRERDEVRPGQTKALYVMSRLAPNFIHKALNKQADKTPLDT